MNKLFFFGLLLLVGAASCRTQCPAYSTIKPAAQTAVPLTAQATSTTNQF